MSHITLTVSIRPVTEMANSRISGRKSIANCWTAFAPGSPRRRFIAKTIPTRIATAQKSSTWNVIQPMSECAGKAGCAMPKACGMYQSGRAGSASKWTQPNTSGTVTASATSTPHEMRKCAAQRRWLRRSMNSLEADGVESRFAR